MNLVELKNVSFAYDTKKILNNISLKINKGEFVAIIGPNGSGKSTLVNIMVGNLIPTSGEVLYDGVKLQNIKNRSFISYVPQKSYSFNASFPASVEEVVSMGLYAKKGIFKRLSKKDWEEVYEALRIVNMFDYKHSLIGRLSGGQLQRVFIARSLVVKPEILFLDEPTTGIDAKSEKALYAILEKLNKEKGITIVMVTHDVWAITDKVSRIICMSEGKINEKCEAVDLTAGELAEVYGYPVKITKHHHNGSVKND
ncbi:zinc transport system ATP-binding protein [Thermoanaerobacter thermohydrosulfuricus]|uniref:ABC transporter related n=4 Tax=Thermoanaerobacter TaxID=1754 RepID=B0KCU9_THEP3|nr:MULTISPECIES: metal ABC transporter ATP-binding protein [Thermoanaerobacter]ABY95556.1 ABC transporter related [Thermoanaerobacter pseudethanolicus ATCC 33223]ADV80491.1 ABC transporter related protein [Thermoanaerobacter brockii subsp. finnii Ako-1]EMT39556.1 ABC-type Mn/Zn transport system, ATPase component [Thermoanaerobacter thermohydrosulfuricus WC1]UZQ83344.1 metal ABC transporter ATP-binding protein [Thermoanaerobacter sp. RKWS2]SDF41501.1 zinc transport system ATP-binding protein [T